MRVPKVNTPLVSIPGEGLSSGGRGHRGKQHIQAIVALRRELAEIGFIGINKATGETVIKSGYPIKKDRLEKSLSPKSTKEGRTIPHTVDDGTPSPLAAARLSALQGEDTIAPKILRVNDMLDFRTEAPERFPPLKPDNAAGAESVGAISHEEAQLDVLRERGELTVEDEAIMAEYGMHDNRANKLEEAALSVADGIMEVVE